MILSNGKIRTVGGKILNSISQSPIPVRNLLNTVNIDIETENKTIPNWNVWVQGQQSGFLSNSTGSTTSLTIQDLSGTFYSDDPADVFPPTSEFPNSVLMYLLYLLMGTSKDFRLDGCTPGRTYDFRFAFYASEDAVYTESSTRINVQGISKDLIDPQGQVLHLIDFNNIVPNASGQILFTVTGVGGNDFPGLNAFIIKEYSA